MRFRSADLSDSNFVGAVLDGVDLTGSVQSGARLDRATVKNATGIGGA